MFENELSSYTITVYELIENKFDFGLNEYQIFDESYRPVLNNAILQAYLFREISCSNVNIWREKLKNRMDLIMRNKYNALYKAKKTEFNPLYNVDLTETYTHEINNNTENTSNTNSSQNGTSNSTNSENQNTTGTAKNNTDTDTNEKGNSLQLHSTFPTEEMTDDDYDNGAYVDSANKSKQENENSSSTEQQSETSETSRTDATEQSNQNSTLTGNEKNNGKSNTVETYTRTNIGSSAGLPFSKALIQLKQFYDKYDLDRQVIAELKDLFMQVW